MSWTELLKFLAAFSTLFAAIGGLIAFLIKSIFKSYLDKDVEEFKAKLQVSINQNQIQFSTLHLERAQVIKDIYYTIVEAERLMKSFLFTRHGDANSTPRIQAFSKLIELEQLIERTKLFFDDRTGKLLDELMRVFRKIDLDKHLADDLSESANQTGNIDDATVASQLRKEIWSELHKEKIPALKQELRTSFQQILGVWKI